MKKPAVHCWQCGDEIPQDRILGVGEFTHNIGRLTGKGFVAFNCESCGKIRYQILNIDHEILNMGEESSNTSFQMKDFLPPGRIDLNQVINFHRKMRDINSMENFLARCSEDDDLKSDILHRPFNRNEDIIELFEKIAGNRQKRAMIVTLNEDRYLKGWEMMGAGTGRKIDFEPRNIFGQALKFDCKTMVYLVDNLQTNFEEKPNQQQVIAVKRLIKAGKILGIPFKDKLVFSGDGFYSYRSLNLI